MGKRLYIAPVGLVAVALVGAGCGSQGGSAGSGGGQAGGQQQSQQAPQPVAQVENLTGKSTAVTLDQEFVEGLESLKLTPGPVGNAKISEAGVASFPITGGNVTYYKPGTTNPYVRGLIEHEGSGLSLKSDETTVELTDFEVNPANSKLTGTVTANGEEAATDAPLFFLNGSTLKPLKTKGNTAILDGTTVTLTKEAADLLNQTFKTDALKKGFPVGVAKITIKTK